jgi:DNA-binding Lrp family transcriptional regulator
MTNLEKRLVQLVQKDISLTERPFKNLAAHLNCLEEDVLLGIQNFEKQGIIRKFAAVIRHQKVGFVKNAMVIWSVDESRCETVGKCLASFSEVTHCYERVPSFLGKYNIFSMIHLRGDDIETFVQKISDMIGIQDFKILISEEEYKKSSMEYF